MQNSANEILTSSCMKVAFVFTVAEFLDCNVDYRVLFFKELNTGIEKGERRFVWFSDNS